MNETKPATEASTPKPTMDARAAFYDRTWQEIFLFKILNLKKWGNKAAPADIPAAKQVGNRTVVVDKK